MATSEDINLAIDSGDRGLQHLVLRVVRPFMTSEGLRYESRQGAGRASIRSMSL